MRLIVGKAQTRDEFLDAVANWAHGDAASLDECRILISAGDILWEISQGHIVSSDVIIVDAALFAGQAGADLVRAIRDADVPCLAVGGVPESVAAEVAVVPRFREVSADLRPADVAVEIDAVRAAGGSSSTPGGHYPIIAVTGPGRGSGTTTVALAVALELARHYPTTTLVDLNMALPTLRTLLRVPVAAGAKTIQDLAVSPRPWELAAAAVDAGSGAVQLWTVGGRRDGWERVTPAGLFAALSTLASYGPVVVDLDDCASFSRERENLWMSVVQAATRVVCVANATWHGAILFSAWFNRVQGGLAATAEPPVLIGNRLPADQRKQTATVVEVTEVIQTVLGGGTFFTTVPYVHDLPRFVERDGHMATEVTSALAPVTDAALTLCPREPTASF